MRKVELSAVTLSLFKEIIFYDDLHFGEELRPIPAEPPFYDITAVTKDKA